MAKQQSDNMEDRFREAAENIAFPPNEEAWNRMEALLDKDKRRRPAFVWWFALLTGLLAGAGIFAYLQNDDKPAVRITKVISRGAANEEGRGAESKSSTEEQKNYNPAEKMRADTISTGGSEQTAHQSGSSSGDVNSDPRSDTVSKSGGFAGPVKNTGEAGMNRQQLADPKHPAGAGRKLTTTGHRKYSANSGRQPANMDNGTASANPGRKSAALPAREASAKPGREEIAGKQQQDGNTRSSFRSDSATYSATQNGLANNAPNQSKAKKSADSSGQQSAQPVVKDESLKKSQAPVRITAASKKWRLDKGLNFSVGARIDATDLHHISLTQFSQLAGATIGYRFSDRLSVQSGVFIQRAKYYAGPQDYYVKPGSYLSMYRISKIDAVCQIYEIPLNLRYDILVGKGLRVYATSGLQSFYLKKESYRYHATGSSGYRQFDSAYSANKNFFSSVWLSAGVEKKITSSLSILTEPYAKLPVTGIGAGKVKLFSGGVQFMLRYQPQLNKRIK